MKIRFLLVVFLLLTACNPRIKNDKTVEVKFIVKAPTIPDTTPVFITGNHLKLGKWNPAAINMNFRENKIWELNLTFPKGEILEYKYTQGSWRTEAADKNGRPLQNFIIQPGKDTVVSNEIKFWQKNGKIPVSGQVTGQVNIHRVLGNDEIPDRNLVVWLPQTYAQNPNDSFPVLYMHDGQNIFNPYTALFKVDWQIDEKVDSLIAQEAIEPIIVVGIYSTKDRIREYSQTEKGRMYRQFVIDSVKPFIDKNYRTMQDAQHTAVGGSSAGAAASFLLAWENPNIFSTAICMSPAFKIDDIDCVAEVTNFDGKKKDLRFYIDNGGIGIEKKLQPGIDSMIKSLMLKGYEENNDLFLHFDSKARHFERDWGERIKIPLEIFYKKPQV